MHRNQPDADAGVRRIFLLETPGNRIHLRLGGGPSHDRLQPADDRQPVGSTGAEKRPELTDRREGHPELGVGRVLEARGHDANNFVGHTVQHDASADDGSIHPKPPHPEAVGDDDYALTAGLTVGGTEGSSLKWHDTHRLEELMCDAGATDLRRIPVPRQRHARATVRGHPFE